MSGFDGAWWVDDEVRGWVVAFIAFVWLRGSTIDRSGRPRDGTVRVCQESVCAIPCSLYFYSRLHYIAVQPPALERSTCVCRHERYSTSLLPLFGDHPGDHDSGTCTVVHTTGERSLVVRHLPSVRRFSQCTSTEHRQSSNHSVEMENFISVPTISNDMKL